MTLARAVRFIFVPLFLFTLLLFFSYFNSGVIWFFLYVTSSAFHLDCFIPVKLCSKTFTHSSKISAKWVNNRDFFYYYLQFYFIKWTRTEIVFSILNDIVTDSIQSEQFYRLKDTYFVVRATPCQSIRVNYLFITRKKTQTNTSTRDTFKC